MAYITIELKTNEKGGTSAEVKYSGVDLRVAEKTYYETLATAATSGRPAHAALIVDSMGQLIATMGYEKKEDE